MQTWNLYEQKNLLCQNKYILLRQRNIHSVWCNTRTNHSAIFEWVNQYWFPNWSDTIFCNWSKYFYSLIWSEWCGESAGQIANKALEIYHFHEMVHFEWAEWRCDLELFNIRLAKCSFSGRLTEALSLQCIA